MKKNMGLLLICAVFMLTSADASPYTAWLTQLDALLGSLPNTLTPNSRQKIEQHKSIAPPASLTDYLFWFKVFEKYLNQIGLIASQKDILVMENLIQFKPESAYQYYSHYCSQFAQYLLQSGPLLTNNERLTIDWYLKAKPESIPYQFASDASLVWQNNWNRLHQRFVKAGSSTHEVLEIYKSVQPTTWQKTTEQTTTLKETNSSPSINEMDAKIKSELETLLKRDPVAVSSLLYEYRHFLGNAWSRIHAAFINQMQQAKDSETFTHEDQVLLDKLLNP